MNNAPLRNALALALGLATIGGVAAQDASPSQPSPQQPSPQQKQELDAARSALNQAAQRYTELSAKYGGNANKVIRIERSALRKPVVGVVLAADEQAGVRIAGVTPDSAAATAGLKSGDRLVSIDGKQLEATSAAARVAHARELLAALDAGKAVALGYERDGRKTSVSVTPKVGERMLVVPEGLRFDGNVAVFAGDDGSVREVIADHLQGLPGKVRATVATTSLQRAVEAEASARRAAGIATMVAPGTRFEVMRLGDACKDADCTLSPLVDALRWNGLNLAAVDAQLGRYFGTSTGVLVLGTGKEMDGLQAGDVIRKIAGKSVASPREAMELLRAQPADGKVAVEYLRDRKPGSAQVGVPRTTTFRMATQKAGEGTGNHRVMVIDKDGKTQTWEGGAAPAWVQALPADGARTEQRVQVIMERRADGTGKTGSPASEQGD